MLSYFTLEHGRINGICYISGKQATQLKGILQPFTPFSSQYKGRGSLVTIYNIEAISTAIPLTKEALYCGLYLNELLYYLLQPNVRQPKLFYCYQQSLAELARLASKADINNRAQQEQILRQFELDLLSFLGFAIPLDHCTKTQLPIVASKVYRYNPQLGFQSSNAVPVLTKYHFRGADLLAIAQQDFSQIQIRKAAKRLTRQAIAPLLAGKKLHSRKLFSTK